jgi:hypothetical protein
MNKLFKNIFKSNKSTSFNVPMDNLSPADLHEMIKQENFPTFITPLYRERIKELYNRGNQFDAVRKLQGLIENQNTKSGKSLL